MSSASVDALTPSAAAVAAKEELEAALGGPFSIWRRSEPGWLRQATAAYVTQADGHVSPSGDMAAEGLGFPPAECDPADADGWLDWLASQRPTAPQTNSHPDGTTLVAVVVDGDDGEAEIVIGRVTCDRRQLISRAATLALRQSQTVGQQRLCEQYADRLSNSFEELTFLRRLTQHIDCCIANRSLGDAAQAILPPLRDLLDVDALCLIGAADSTSGSVRAERILGLTGVLLGSSSSWLEFITQLGPANRRVVVKNYAGELARRSRAPLPHVRSLVLAPIAKDGVIYGWLLGINRQLREHNSLAFSNSLGEDEIGSMEATLLESAALMLGTHAANHRLFEEKEALVVDVIHTLVNVIEAKDAYTCGHSNRVALIARRIGAELQLPAAECEDIFLAGLLHDIGKIGIVDDVLLKPGKLSEEEFSQIKQHPEIGARLLQGLRPLEKLIPGVLHHHEAIDGSGYPYGLVGDQIPLMARILAVADSFDALTSDRPYRRGRSLTQAEEILRGGSGTQWDARVTAAYFAARKDIIEIGAHWQEKLQELLQRSQDPQDRRTVGAALVASLGGAMFSASEAQVARAEATP